MLFLQRYNEIRHIGRGSYGQVYLVEDQKRNNQRFALKVISKQEFGDHFQLKEDVEREIQCLKIMKSRNIIKLIQHFQTKDTFYLVLQYCELRDVKYYMDINKKNVLQMEQATLIMADVIRGLEAMHTQGYLHRDIKPQNVLLKTQNGIKVAKLGDLGMVKQAEQVTGSLVGTKWFISPQILARQKYGFQVDMWAFGVFFYYILNGEGLFKQSFCDLKDKKQQKEYLLLQAYNFSYKKHVQKSRFKRLENCTYEMQDLFKRIFQLDPKQRITFSELRQHPIFKKHFSNTNNASSSKIYERNRFNSKIKAVKAQIMEGQPYFEQIESTEIHMKIHPEYPDQSQCLLRKKNQIYFIKCCAQIFYSKKMILSDHERLMITYFLTKYYLVLQREFYISLDKNNLALQYSTYVWDKIKKSSHFKQFKKDVKSQLNRTIMELISLHDQCQQVKDKINEINRSFQASLQKPVDQSHQAEQFKKQYRQACQIIYRALRKMLTTHAFQNQIEKQKIWFLMTLIIISRCFNRMITSIQFLAVIFREYFDQRNISTQEFMFMDLFYWLQKQDAKLLQSKIDLIIHNYFKKQ